MGRAPTNYDFHTAIVKMQEVLDDKHLIKTDYSTKVKDGRLWKLIKIILSILPGDRFGKTRMCKVAKSIENLAVNEGKINTKGVSEEDKKNLLKVLNFLESKAKREKNIKAIESAKREVVQLKVLTQDIAQATLPQPVKGEAKKETKEPTTTAPEKTSSKTPAKPEEEKPCPPKEIQEETTVPKEEIQTPLAEEIPEVSEKEPIHNQINLPEPKKTIEKGVKKMTQLLKSKKEEVAPILKELGIEDIPLEEINTSLITDETILKLCQLLNRSLKAKYRKFLKNPSKYKGPTKEGFELISAYIPNLTRKTNLHSVAQEILSSGDAKKRKSLINLLIQFTNKKRLVLAQFYKDVIGSEENYKLENVMHQYGIERTSSLTDTKLKSWSEYLFFPRPGAKEGEEFGREYNLGSLYEALHATESEVLSNQFYEFSTQDLVNIWTQIAKGLAVLEKIHLVQGNLTLHNIRIRVEVNREGKPEIHTAIADWGFSHNIEKAGKDLNSTRELGQMLCPEYIKSRQIHPKTDLWAFGLLILDSLGFGNEKILQGWSILSKSDAVIRDHVEKNLASLQNEHALSPGLINILKGLLEPDSDKRTNPVDLVAQLESVKM